MLDKKPDSKENFIRVYQQMLRDEQNQTELIDLIAEEQKQLHDASELINIELIDGQVKKKK